MNTAIDHFAPTSTARAGGGEARLDSVRTSPFLSKLGNVLEKYLDIIGETYEFSPERPDGKATSFALKRPRTFEGDGMAVTFPFRAGVGIFLISVRGGILPDWFANPGIAGRSRLFLLASELEQIFGTDWEKEPISEPEDDSSPKTSEELPGEISSLKPSQKTVSTVGTFYATADFFYGSVSVLESLFNGLAEEELTEFRAFSIRKFDGREGYAWMLGPTRTAEILRKNAVAETFPTRTIGTLRPVRSLESVVVDTAGSEEVLPAENALNEVETVELTGETSDFPAEILKEFPRIAHQFHFRSRTHSPARRARREEAILSQIRYENPIYTQRWRKQSAQYIERIEAELQTAALLASSLFRIQSEVRKPSNSFLGESAPGTVATLVETRLADVKEVDLFKSIETVDFTEAPVMPISEWAAEWVSADMWVENPAVVTRTFQSSKGENTPETKIFTPESLLEAKEKEIEYPTPFSVDFSLELDILATETLKIRAPETNILEISVPVSILLGRAKRSVAEILGWKVGDVVNLGQKTEETSEVFVNGGCVGCGFPVEWENRVGIRWACRET